MNIMRIKPLALTLSFCTLAALSVPDLAFAQGSTENMALKNYEKAKVAYTQGDFALAAELLEKAYAEDPDLIYQYNRIRALQAMKSYDEALKTIDLYRGPMSRDPDQRFSDLEELEAQIKAEKQAFDKDNTDKTDKTDNTDTKDQGDQNTTDPKDTDKTDNADNPDKIIAPPATDPDPGKGKRTAGWVLTGVGLATIAGTSPFWTGLAIQNDPCYGYLDADPSSGNPCLTDIERRENFDNKVQTHKIVSAVGLGVGSVATITGLVLVLTNGKPKTESSRIELIPTISKDTSGAMVRFTF